MHNFFFTSIKKIITIFRFSFFFFLLCVFVDSSSTFVYNSIKLFFLCIDETPSYIIRYRMFLLIQTFDKFVCFGLTGPDLRL